MMSGGQVVINLDAHPLIAGNNRDVINTSILLKELSIDNNMVCILHSLQILLDIGTGRNIVLKNLWF